MLEKIKNLKIKILKNAIYLMICVLIIILAVWKLDLKKFFDFDNILENISYANTNINKQKILKIPLNIDLSNEANVLSNSTWFDQWFEDKLKNYAANIYTLNGNFDKALDNINNDDRRYYFNIWNIKLFQWYTITNQNIKKFDKTQWKKAYSLFGESIDNYNISAQTLWTWSNYSNYIINNRNIAYKFKFLAGVQMCVEMFTSYIDSFDKLQQKTKDISSLFDKERAEIEDFIKTTKDQEIIKCLKSLRTSILQSQISINSINENLKTYKNSALKILDDYLTEPDKCMNKLDKDSDKIEDSIDQISWSLAKFQQLHEQFYKFIKWDNLDSLKQLCQQAQSQSQQQQQDQNNQKIQEGLSKLDDVFNQSKNWQNWQQQQDQQWQGQDQQQDNQDQNKQWSSSEPSYNELPRGYEQEVTNTINNNSQQWIQQMNNLRSDPNYNVDNYINQLFKEFWWNKKSFTDQSWTWSQYNNNR